jgi:hypothetical protein
MVAKTDTRTAALPCGDIFCFLFDRQSNAKKKIKKASVGHGKSKGPARAVITACAASVHYRRLRLAGPAKLMIIIFRKWTS